MVGCVLSQLKPSELYITLLTVEKATTFSTAKNVQLIGFYPIQKNAINT